MLKDVLRQQEPLVYQALENACVSDRISHAYLFVGPSGTPKKEAAYLLAESLFCTCSEGLACETCETCQRVQQGNHLDFMVLDGAEKAISKKDVDALQQKFAKTSAEEGRGNRCYIILNADNSSLSAMNSMLKFLEEPGPNMTAILTCDNVNRLLPTIVSRCTMIPFTKIKEDLFYQKALSEGIPSVDAYYASHIMQDMNQIKENFEKESYRNAFLMFEQYLKGARRELLVDFDIIYRCKEKSDTIQMVIYFLDLLNLYAHDVITSNDQGYPWYQELVKSHQSHAEAFAQLIVICSEEKDACNKFHDISLEMAKVYQRLEDFNSVLYR